MLSYAQHAEDVVLARVFAGQPGGFYVDVGANHPELDSVTRHFYERGWSGINVEPGAGDHALLCAARPRDVNLRVALAERPGRARLYQTGEDNRGGSTLVPALAARLGAAGAALHEVEVEVTTLAEVCARHVTGPIDFLKIDVEGSEASVIRGGDWRRFRPRVVVVEATEPGTPEPSHQDWEPVLLAADYRLVLFDGLNRFYLRAEDAALRPRLAAPANPHDAWEPHRYVSRLAEMERYVADLRARQAAAEAFAADLEQRTRAAQRLAAERERYALDAREHFERCQAWAKVLEAKVRRFESHLGLLPDTLPPPPEGARGGVARPAAAAAPAFLDVPELAAGLGVVTIVDVGAQALPDQDDVYRPLVRSGRARVVGFEPLAEARAARQRQDPGFVVHPHALGDGAPRTLHRTATSATSSLYRPDLMRMADFAGLAATCRVVGETPVSTVRLDDVADCRGAAFCKLDVQGAELDVLRGAPRLLTELLVLHTETEFVPLYQGQPLFADLDAHLRGAGFELYAFPHLEHYRYETRGAPPDGSPSRLLWGDAVYVPTRERILALAPGRALALAWIMHELYRAHDFCRWVLTHLDARDGGARVAAYDRALAPDPVRLAR